MLLTETTNSVRAHQTVLLAMLKDLDAVCRAEGIRYMLFAGTALGAVRHAGFIPWDDDLDILLPRKAYERLLDALERRLDPERYYVQRAFSAHWPMQFSKLRLNGTTCIERFHPKDPALHQGVYIDLFPCDNLSDSRAVRALQFLAAKAVIAKALFARGYETDSFLKKSFMLLCRPLPLSPLRRFVERRNDADSRMVHTFFAGSSKYRKSVFPRAWLTETVDLPFEDGQFPVSAEYDAMLRQLYGDYMTPPPPEAREQKVHAVILDLQRPYTDYLDTQKTMRIDSYARSIR